MQLNIETLERMGQGAKSALGRHAPESVRKAARRLGFAGQSQAEPAQEYDAQVLFITEDEPSDFVCSNIGAMRSLLEAAGVTTQEVCCSQVSEACFDSVRTLVLVRCPAPLFVHEATIRAHGRGDKVFYYLDDCEPLGCFALDAPASAKAGLVGFEQDCASRRIRDALLLCDAALVPDADLAAAVSPLVDEVACLDAVCGDGLVELLRPAPLASDDASEPVSDHTRDAAEEGDGAEPDDSGQGSTAGSRELPRPLALVTGGVAKARREGIVPTWKAGTKFLHGKARDFRYDLLNPTKPIFFDVLFVNGCDYSLPHPIRYRVDHQVEQLRSNGLAVNVTDAWNLRLEDVTSARAFIFFRCPYTSELGDFVDLAHRLNKVVYFDIDDLVIDRAYTDTIKYLDTMSGLDRARYNDGVDRMGRMLKACGRAITTTERLAEELGKSVAEVLVNRNTASEEMLLYSNRAVYERDVLPFKDESEVAPDEMTQWNWARERAASRNPDEVTVGYFSGSITHNDDVAMILPAIIDVMEQRPNVKLCIAGILDIPDALEPYRERLVSSGFGSWKQLPDMIANVDVNIAPMEDTVFNEAKSENKWVEAALVKVPTIASNIGAFAKMVEDGVTGLLCDSVDDWRDALLELVDNPDKRRAIGEAAYEKCVRDCTTIGAGPRFALALRRSFTTNVFMALPALKTSGGVLVALKHCSLLQNAGYDVTIIDIAIKAERFGKPFLEAHDGIFPVLYGRDPRNVSEPALFRGSIDKMVATMWSTVWFFDHYPRIGQKLYLVQNYETDFGQPPEIDRILANQTYARDDTRYLTISQWCKGWLEESFGQEVRYAPNGIDMAAFPVVERKFDGSRRIRILIEGDSDSKHKNVSESFDITNKLDPERFEVWYMSYSGSPKPHWRVDKFLHNVPHGEVGRVYADCDILLKTSILESFSYPPLEMMATGGYVVAVPNGGNSEYLVHGENCLLFESGDMASAIASIELIATRAELRATLGKGGMDSVRAHSWDVIEDQVLALYAGE